jgi:hypothetical protein
MDITLIPFYGTDTMQIHMAGIAPPPQTAPSSYRAIDVDAPDATTSGEQAARLPTLNAIDNRYAPSAPEREPPSYHDAICGTDRIERQAPINDLPFFVEDRTSLMTERDHVIGQWEGLKWDEMSRLIHDFVAAPMVLECGFSAKEAEPALRAMATWVEAITRNPPPSPGARCPVDMLEGNNLALRSLATFNACLKDRADRLGAYNPDCKTMFIEFATKIDAFLLDAAPVRAA